MVVHEPEGQTTISALRKICTKRSATGRASFQYPVLNAGCPQQVCSRGNSVSYPIRRSTRTMSRPTSGASWSTKHGTNRDTFAIPAAYSPDHGPAQDKLLPAAGARRCCATLQSPGRFFPKSEPRPESPLSALRLRLRPRAPSHFEATGEEAFSADECPEELPVNEHDDGRRKTSTRSRAFSRWRGRAGAPTPGGSDCRGRNQRTLERLGRHPTRRPQPGRRRKGSAPRPETRAGESPGGREFGRRAG